MYWSILWVRKHQAFQRQNDPIHHFWMSLFFPARLCCLSIPRTLSFSCFWTALMIEQFLSAFVMTYAKAATQRKGQCQCLLFSNMSLKKLNIAILNPNYLKTYRTPLRKFQAPEEIINPMKLVMWFTKLKRLHKRVMNRHHFSSDLGNCVDRFVCKCSDDFWFISRSTQPFLECLRNLCRFGTHLLVIWNRESEFRRAQDKKGTSWKWKKLFDVLFFYLWYVCVHFGVWVGMCMCRCTCIHRYMSMKARQF